MKKHFLKNKAKVGWGENVSEVLINDFALWEIYFNLISKTLFKNFDDSTSVFPNFFRLCSIYKKRFLRVSSALKSTVENKF